MDNTTVVSDSVFYNGVSGYGITFSYFFMHVLLLAVGVTGIVLNVVVVYTLQYRDTLSDVSSVFIINLARSDVINACLSIYAVCYNLVHFKHYYECALRGGLVTGVHLSSTFHLFALTFDRYYKIMYPYKYCLTFKESLAVRYSILVWLISAGVGLLPVIGWRKAVRYVNYCSFFGVMSDTYLEATLIMFMALFLMMMFCYASIVYVALIQTRKVVHVRGYPASSGSRALWWGPTKTVIIITVFYFICWTPLGTCVFLHLLGGFPAAYTDDNKGTVLAYCSSLLYMNVLGNPIIYALKIRAVKTRVQNIISFCRIKSKTSVPARTPIEAIDVEPRFHTRLPESAGDNPVSTDYIASVI